MLVAVLSRQQRRSASAAVGRAAASPAEQSNTDWTPQLATLYATLVATRNVELQVHWARYNIQAAINAGLLFAFVSARPLAFIDEHRTVIALGGLFLTILWFWMTAESKNVLVGRWDRHIRQFEERHPACPYPLLSEVNREQSQYLIRQPLSFVQWVLIMLVASAWLYFLVCPVPRLQ
jgi:hypothetical protein